MADDTIQLVDKLCTETECCICNETFSDPRNLPCSHTFCYKCLQGLASKLKKKFGDTVSCPVCRKGFSIPTEGMDDLPKNITMQRLIDLVEESSSASNQSRSETVPFNNKCQNRDGQVGDSKDPEEEEECAACNLHPSKKRDIYCVGCKTLICLTCLADSHKSHDWSDTEKAAKRFLVELENTVEKIEGLSDEIAIIKDRLREEKQDLIKQLAQTEKMIRDRDTVLKELVNSHTNCLIDELSSVKQTRFKEANARMDEIERHMLALETFSVHCRDVVSWKSNSAICSAANASLDRAQELKRAHESHLQKKIPSVKVCFKPSDVGEGQSTNNIVGQLEEKERNFEEKNKETLWTRYLRKVRKSITGLYVLFRGAGSSIRQQFLIVGLVTCISIIVLLAAFFLPPNLIKINKDVNPKFLKRIDVPCTQVGIGLFQNNIVVLCNFPRQIILYQENGIPEHFNINHEITDPEGMVVTSDCLFVFDYKTKCIYKIMKREIWSMKQWLCGIKLTDALSTSIDGNAIVVTFDPSTSSNLSVTVYNTDGVLLLSFMLPEKINSPNHILQLRNRNFIISYGEAKTSGICEMSPEGHIVRCFIPTSTDQELNIPWHIAIDGEDRLLVADIGNNRVVLLNSDLSWNRVILTKHEHSIYRPYRLSYDKPRKRLLVGQHNGNIDEYLF